MKRFTYPLAGIPFSLLVVLAPASAATVAASRPAVPSIHGSVLSLRGHTVLIDAGRSVVTVNLSGGRIESADGATLTTAAVRAEDHVVTHGKTLVDLSQRQVTLQGIVTLAPLETGDPIALAVHGGTTVLAEMEASTGYHDPTGQTSAIADLLEGDSITLTGAYDAMRGEITQTTSLKRLGPRRTAHG